MDSASKPKKIIKIPRFTQIDSIEYLIMFLKQSSNNMPENSYIHHYTTYENLRSMMKTNLWHLGNCKDMTDKYEYIMGDENEWNNTFFSSFTMDSRENLALWSLYSQRWDQGVRISILKDDVVKWLESIKEVKEIDKETGVLTGKSALVTSDNLFLTAVLYDYNNSIITGNSTNSSSWTTSANLNVEYMPNKKSLTGYVKDLVWFYEREARIMAKFDNTLNFQKIAIDLPDEVIKSMKFTSSPMFTGGLYYKLWQEFDHEYTAYSSEFKQKLFFKE